MGNDDDVQEKHVTREPQQVPLKPAVERCDEAQVVETRLSYFSSMCSFSVGHWCKSYFGGKMTNTKKQGANAMSWQHEQQ